MIKNDKIITRKEIDEAFKNLLDNMLKDDKLIGSFQNVDWLNNIVVTGTIRIELNITDLKHLV